MDDHELERKLLRLAEEKVRPAPELLARTKARLRRSRIVPWLIAASLASQAGSVAVGYWLLFVFPAGWLFKGLWLGGLAAALALPLVLLAQHLPEQNWPLSRA